VRRPQRSDLASRKWRDAMLGIVLAKPTLQDAGLARNPAGAWAVFFFGIGSAGIAIGLERDLLSNGRHVRGSTSVALYA
jgi:hypothetical protein